MTTKDKIIAYLFHYWLAMNAAGVQSAKITATAFVSAASMHALNDSVQALPWQHIAAILMVSFGHGMLNYLEANPLKLPLAGPSAPAPSSSPATPVTIEPK